MVVLPLMIFLVLLDRTTVFAAISTAPVNTEWTLESGIEPDFMLLNVDTNHALGFTRACSTSPIYYLSISIPLIPDVECTISSDTVVSVWQANRDFPLSANATLAFGEDGNLVLSQGPIQVWSSGTSGRGVVAMEVLDTGNLVLLGSGGEIIWQSFDHPTDLLLPKQKFVPGSKLVSSVSYTNRSQGSFFLELQPRGLVGRARAPGTEQTYAVWDLGSHDIAYLMIESCYLVAYNRMESVVATKKITAPFCLQFGKFLKLHYDGTVRFWNSYKKSEPVPINGIGECGKYGVLRQSTCACLDFDPSLQLEPIDRTNPLGGCSLPGEMSLTDDRCNSSGSHELVEAPGYDYQPLEFMQGIPQLSPNACKESCLLNCSCIAAFFQVGIHDSACYHVTTLYTVAVTPLRQGYASSMFLKIKTSGGALPPGRRSAKALRIVANTAIGAFSVIIAVSVLIALIIVRWRKRMARISAVGD
ncbi:hypothetical protein SELMODRAFT_427043 [Selaginella moellendorffii]|uniref:Bulb-type lectin domain-containing protein n=1 Tax=Selaginella moellendorffii TaxID=88036 RepID=D8SYC0_SELML|nr:EP1-like glycoprotein 3 [Selaginella moellendorffii]EFJ10766.1 hypothetical protein SELMODRAFT_427043 [Selaginella moellendorffii]|eukprot:XP_002988347.1 EP1-like glycoprotein 3 [Selaginella moellendorffii]